MADIAVDSAPILDPQNQAAFAQQIAQKRAAIAVPASVQPSPVLPAVSAKAQRDDLMAGTTKPLPGQMPPVAASPTPSSPAPVKQAPPQTAEDKQASYAENKLQHDEGKKAGVERVMDASKNIGSDPDSWMGRHPGIAKIARTGAEIGSGLLRGVETAGDILAPRIAARIPGTELNRAVNLAQDEATVNDAEKQRLDFAQGQEAMGKAQTSNAPSLKEMSGGAVDPAHPELGSQQALYNEKTGEIQYKGPMKPATASTPLAAPEVDNANKGFLDRFKVLNPDAKQLPAQYVLPPNATKEQRDFVDKQLEQVEKSTGTKAQNDITEKMRQDAAAEHQREFNEHEDEKLVNYTDPKTHTLVSGTKAEAKAAGAKDADIHGPTNPALQEKSRQAYTQYGRIIDNAQTAANSLTAWDENTPQGKINRQAAMDVAKTYWDHVGGTVLAASGAVSPEFLQQAINSDAYRRMDAAGREHMQNMFQLWSDAVNIVKQETGGVPKGAEILKKEDAILPKPDKTMEMNEKALLNLAKRIHTDAGEYARPSDMDPLQTGIVPASAMGHLEGKDGKIVGYRDANGKDVRF